MDNIELVFIILIILILFGMFYVYFDNKLNTIENLLEIKKPSVLATNMGYYNPVTQNILVETQNLSNAEVFKTFLHELGHKNCYPDQTEECANLFMEKYWQYNMFK